MIIYRRTKNLHIFFVHLSIGCGVENMSRKIKSLLRTKLPNIIAFILLDLLVVLFSSVFSIWMRFDFENVPEMYITNSYQYLFIDFAILLIVYLLFKLYTSVWKYASINELLNIIIGSSMAEIIMYVYKTVFNIQMPKSYYIMQLFLI